MKKSLLIAVIILASMPLIAQVIDSKKAYIKLREFSWLLNQNKQQHKYRGLERLESASLYNMNAIIKLNSTKHFYYKNTNNKYLPNNGVYYPTIFDSLTNPLYFSNNLSLQIGYPLSVADSEIHVSEIYQPALTDTVIKLSSYDFLNRIVSETGLNSSNLLDTLYTYRYTYSNNSLGPDTIENRVKIGSGIMENLILQVLTYMNNNVHTTSNYYYYNGNYGLEYSDTLVYNSTGRIEKYALRAHDSSAIVYNNQYYYSTAGWIDSIAYFTTIYDTALIIENEWYEKFTYNANNTLVSVKEFHGNSNIPLYVTEFKIDALKNVYEYNLLSRDGDTNYRRQILQTFTQQGNVVNSVFKKLYPQIPAYETTDSAHYIYNSYIPLDNTNYPNLTTTFSISPNPTNTNAINLYYASDKQNSATINITDVLGRIVHTQKISLVNGNSIIPFNIESLNSGNYFLTIITKDNINKSLQFVKQ